MVESHAKASQELEQARKRLGFTKYILICALCAWPLGIFFSFRLSFIIFAVLIALWAVTTYIATMHYIACKNRHKKS